MTIFRLIRPAFAAVVVVAGFSFGFYLTSYQHGDRLWKKSESFLSVEVTDLHPLETTSPEIAIPETAIPETAIPSNDGRSAHSTGYTIFDDLYLRNGTFYVVTSNVSAFPNRLSLISRPLDMGKEDLTPTDQVRFLHTYSYLAHSLHTGTSLHYPGSCS